MSGLAGLLAAHKPAGVYRWHAHFHVPDVQHAVEHAGWEFGYLDGIQAQTKTEVLSALGETLEFPDHYGENLDALVDCLRDTASDKPLLLLWDHWGVLAREDEHAFQGVLSALRDRVGSDAGAEVCVLLRGEGPDVPDVSSID